MKVLHVIPSVSELSGGPAQALFPMCRALEEKGVEIVIASTDHGIDRQTQGLAPEKFNGLSTILFPSQVGDSFKYSRPMSEWLRSNVRDFDVVHIHAVFNHSCLAAAKACRKEKVPYIVRPLGTLSPWGMQQKSIRKQVFWQLAGKRMLNSAGAIHYTAKAEKDATEKSLKLNHGYVIPLGVEIKSDPASLDSDLLRSQFRKLAIGSYILVLSRLHPKKGLDVFIEAFLKLKKRDEFGDWRLVLAGEGPDDYVAMLRSKVRAHGAEEEVIFTGWLKGKIKDAVLRSASLLALPSYYENFGLCVIEAFAFGVPVLISPHVDLADDILAAGAGWIEAVDARALQSTLTEILRSPDERRSRGLAGLQLSAKFTWPNVADQLTNLYNRVSNA